MSDNLKFQRLDNALAARIADWRVLQDYEEPSRIYLHSPRETVPGEFGPVYVVRYVNGVRKLARHATAAELVKVRDQARKIAQAHGIVAELRKENHNMTGLDLYIAARSYVEEQGETPETAEAFALWLESEHREDAEYIERRSMRELWKSYRRAFLEETREVWRVDSFGQRRRETVTERKP